MRYFAANAPKSAKFLGLTAFLWITFAHNLLGCSRMDDIAKQFISASEYKVRYIDREHICNAISERTNSLQRQGRALLTTPTR